MNNTLFLVDTMKAVIAAERDAEVEQSRPSQSFRDLMRRGIALSNLHVDKIESAALGRVCIVFSLSSCCSHNIRVGDIVQIDKGPESGVVSAVKRTRVDVSVDFQPDISFPTGLHSILKMANEVTFQRCLKAVGQVGKSTLGLHRVVLGEESPSEPSRVLKSISFDNKTLNVLQKKAVYQALESKQVFLLHGPPGTGKSTTVTEIIHQMAQSGARVLVTAPSNIAVDTLVEKLSLVKERQWKMCRIGHPARVLENVIEHSLEYLLHRAEDTALAYGIRKEIAEHMKQSQWDKNILRHLRKELREKESRAVERILDNCSVILSTSVGAAHRLLHKRTFDVVVVDEAAQVLEAEAWIGILKGTCKLILAGDHRQLPPTLLSSLSVSLVESIGGTLFERLALLFPSSCLMLEEQYRMHQCIMSWSSSVFYNHRLSAHPSVSSHLLHQLQGVKRATDTSHPLIVIDTTGTEGMYEEDINAEEDGSESRRNEGEALVVKKVIEGFLQLNIQRRDIGVITPYRGQVQLLNELMEDVVDIEIGTVDGFQGREKEVIVLSLVRSNDDGEVGFLDQVRRLNVAITRARRCCVVVMNAFTIERCSNGILRSFVDFCVRYAEYRPVQLYVDAAESFRVFQSEEHVEEYQMKDMSGFTVKVGVKGKGKETERTKKQEKQKTKEKFIEKKSYTKSNDNVLTDTQESVQDYEQTDTVLESIEMVFRTLEPGKSYAFPSSLSSYHRLAVHEMAEKEGIKHWSTGEGDSRAVHVMMCLPSALKKEVVELSYAPLKPSSTPLKPKKKKKPKKMPKEDVSEDQILDEMLSKKNICHFTKCKKSVKLVGMVCQYCNYRFCIEHGSGLFHGCSNASKKAAKEKWRSDCDGSVPLKDWKRNYLKTQLGKKISDQTQERTRKEKKR